MDLNEFLMFLALHTKQLLNSGSFSLLLQIKKSFFDMVIINY